MKDPERFLEAAINWAKKREDIQAMAVVGSYARGTARSDSDVDLVIIAKDRLRYLNQTDWLNKFGLVRTTNREDWGLLQALRTIYSDGLEVEFGFCGEEWARIDPVDEGTRQVIVDGMKILFDPMGILVTVEKVTRRGLSASKLP